MKDNADAIKKRLRQRENMFLRRLMGMLVKMAKADGKVDAWETHAAEGAFARFPRAAARRKCTVKEAMMSTSQSMESRLGMLRMTT